MSDKTPRCIDCGAEMDELAAGGHDCPHCGYRTYDTLRGVPRDFDVVRDEEYEDPFEVDGEDEEEDEFDYFASLVNG